MIRADDLRFLTPASTGLRSTVAAMLLLSAVGHVGAVVWAVSGTPANEITASAGGSVMLEVTLVEGPERGAAAALAPAPDSPKTEDALVPEVDVPKDTKPSDHAVNADRHPRAALPAADDLAIVLPASLTAAPVPPPKPPSAAPETEISPVPREAAPSDGLPASALDSASLSPKESGEKPSVTAASASGEAGRMRTGTTGAAPRADNHAPSYPSAARRRGQEGRVLLRVEVLPDGTVGAVSVERSSGVDSLDAAALEAVRRWRFRPAHRSGQPVPATVQVPIRFALN